MQETAVKAIDCTPIQQLIYYEDGVSFPDWVAGGEWIPVAYKATARVLSSLQDLVVAIINRKHTQSFFTVETK